MAVSSALCTVTIAITVPVALTCLSLCSPCPHGSWILLHPWTKAPLSSDPLDEPGVSVVASVLWYRPNQLMVAYAKDTYHTVIRRQFSLNKYIPLQIKDRSHLMHWTIGLTGSIGPLTLTLVR